VKWAKIFNFHPIIFIPISSLALSNQTKSSIRFMKFLILERIKSGWRYGEIISMLESSNCIDCWNEPQRTKSIHSNRIRYIYWINRTLIDCDIPWNWDDNGIFNTISILFQYYFNTILIQYFVPDLLFTYDSALKIEYGQIIPDNTSFGVQNSDAIFSRYGGQKFAGRT